MLTGSTIQCPHHSPLNAHRGTCGLVAQLTGLPRERCTVSRGACYDCQRLAPSEDNPVVASLALTAARRHAPDRSVVLAQNLKFHANRREADVPDVPQDTVVLNSDAHGIGDAMIMAWASEGAKEGPVRLVHYATGAKRAFLEMFGQPVTDQRAGSVETFDAYQYELRDEKGRIPRIYSRSRRIGIHSEPKRPQLQAIPEAARKWAEEVASNLRGPRNAPLVLLFPQTVYTSREWPASYWVDLAWRLRNRGYGVAVILGNDDDRYHNTPGYWYGYPWTNTVALMQLADLVVGNDSGPVHVAGTLDVPTLALMGPTKATIFAHMPSVQSLAVSSSTIDCVGCHFGPPFRASCDQGCQALFRLHVESVESRIVELVDPGPKEEANVIPFGASSGAAA